MGTWDAGPFGNDTAADFCGDLDAAAAEEREDMIRGVLVRSIGAAGYLEAPESERAVAAAALVAAQCPEGEPVDAVYGPNEPLPDLTALRDLAVRALDRVMTGPGELRDLWAESGGGRAEPGGGPWQARVRRVRNALEPAPPGEQLTLI